MFPCCSPIRLLGLLARALLPDFVRACLAKLEAKLQGFSGEVVSMRFPLFSSPIILAYSSELSRNQRRGLRSFLGTCDLISFSSFLSYQWQFHYKLCRIRTHSSLRYKFARWATSLQYHHWVTKAGTTYSSHTLTKFIHRSSTSSFSHILN